MPGKSPFDRARKRRRTWQRLAAESLSKDDAPPHMTPEDFRKWGHAAIDWIAEYMETVADRTVASVVTPGEIRANLPEHAPQSGEDFDVILRDLSEIILPGITHWQSPNFFGYFPANASGPAILGDLISSGLGVQGMLWATSPACTELETHVLDWVAEMLHLPEAFRSTGAGGGVIQDSASSATLCALLAARERATNGFTNDQGLGQSLTGYTSREAHSSVEKAMMIAGLGRENLRRIPVDGDYAMLPEALDRQIKKDLREGLTPAFICATVGTTSSTAIDPVPAIADVAQQHKIWLHVDAALAGAAAVCPEFRYVNDGLDRVDSYCFDPHKWMLTNFDCDCMYVADRESLTRALTVVPEYLRTGHEGVIDYRNWQIPLGRRFRALKLWCVIRHYGADGIRLHIRRGVEHAKAFAHWVDQHADLERVAPAPLNLVCFRHTGGDEKTERLHRAIIESGEIFVTHTKLGGRYVIRFATGGPATEMRHVEQAWKHIKETIQNLPS